MRSALHYRTEIWALTDRLMDAPQRHDHQMLRYMAGVKWQDGKSRIEVRNMCGVETSLLK